MVFSLSRLFEDSRRALCLAGRKVFTVIVIEIEMFGDLFGFFFFDVHYRFFLLQLSDWHDSV